MSTAITQTTKIPQTKEIWIDIVGFEGYYQVSQFGRVRSLDRLVPHKLCGFLRIKGKMMTPRMSVDKYLIVALSKKRYCKWTSIHLLVLSAFQGPKPKGKESIHIDGNKENCHNTNLKWGTHSENMSDREIHLGKRKRTWGRHGNKISRRTKETVRRLYKIKKPILRIAKETGVSRSYVRKLLKLEGVYK